MKKTVIIVVVVVLILALLIGGAFATVMIILSQPKDAVSVEQFKALVEQRDYAIYDAKDQFSVYPYIQSAQIAIKADDSHQIEFYKFADSSYATNFFNNNVGTFENSKGSSNIGSNVQGSNYAKYVSKTNGKYRVVSIIADTGIYVDVDESYEQEVNSILQELGY